MLSFITRRHALYCLVAALACAAVLLPAPLSAQVDPNDPNAVDPNNPNQPGQPNIGAVGGVIVDADGVVRMQSFADPTGQLHRNRQAAARAALGQKVVARSPLRKVS